MSVGSVCVLGEPWLELCTSQLFPAAAASAPLPETLLRARLLYFPNKEQFSTLSPRLAGFSFLKIRCKPGKFKARRV